MGILRRLGNHFGDAYIKTQMQAAQAGIDLTKNSKSNVVKAIGMGGGLIVGTVIGAVEFFNPITAAKNIIAPEEEKRKEIENALEKITGGDDKENA